MTLDPRSHHPSTRHYVLKLHRDARPGEACWLGRIEHLASGRQFDFDSAEGLLRWLAQDADHPATASEESA